MTLPRPSRRKPSANASPSEAVLLVAQHHHVAAEGVLHVPGRLADARLPVEPRLAQQPAEDPAVDVAAAVVAHVDDEPLAVEHRVELARPLGDVVAAHRAQVHVADLAAARPAPPAAGACTPTRGSAGRLRPLCDDRHRRSRRVPPPRLRLDAQQHLLARPGRAAATPRSGTDSAATPLTSSMMSPSSRPPRAAQRRQRVGPSGSVGRCARRGSRPPARRARARAEGSRLDADPGPAAVSPPCTKMCSADSSATICASRSFSSARSVTRRPAAGTCRASPSSPRRACRGRRSSRARGARLR